MTEVIKILKNENQKNFAKALRCLDSGRKSLCKSLEHIQNTPVLDKHAVNIISDAIDSLDRSISKLNTEYQKKIEWIQ